MLVGLLVDISIKSFKRLYFCFILKFQAAEAKGWDLHLNMFLPLFNS